MTACPHCGESSRFRHLPATILYRCSLCGWLGTRDEARKVKEKHDNAG